jgi:nitrite reductase/ring-hydroxylating ferredoxin subunit
MEGRMTVEEQTTALPRRQVLCGILAVGLLGTTVLTACSGDEDPAATNDQPTGGTTTNSGNAGGAIAQVSAIPVGGGTVVQAGGKSIVIVQPAAGDIKAYDASCTHQGTTVGAPQDGVMTCPNHGSKFKAADGSVLNGPAGAPLRAIAVTVSGDNITLA